jgi:hypothetical protein
MAWGYETDGEVLDTQGGVLHDHGQHVKNMADTFDEEATLPADVFAGFAEFLPDLEPSYKAAVSQVQAVIFNIGSALEATGSAMRDAARTYVETDRRAVEELLRAQREPDVVQER